MLALKRILIAAVFLLLTLSASSAQDAGALVDALAQGSFNERGTAISALVASGSPAAVPVLQALTDGNLYVRKSDNKVFIATADGEAFKLTDPVTNADAGSAQKAELEKIKVNNALREVIANATGGLTLFSPDAKTRKAAVLSVLKSGDPSALPALEKAMHSRKRPIHLGVDEDGRRRRNLEKRQAARCRRWLPLICWPKRRSRHCCHAHQLCSKC